MKTNINKPIKALIELPTWLGDFVMATPAIENIINYYTDIEITFIGSLFSIEAIKNHPKVSSLIIIDKSYISLYKTSKSLGLFDVYFTFRNSLSSKLLKLLIKAKNKYQFNSRKYQNCHQVEKYANFINDSLKINFSIGNLKIYKDKTNQVKKSKILGINPGASYGSAKRWYPDQFAKIAIDLSNKFDIIIFGGPGEQDFAAQIEKILIQNNVKKFQNLAGKTSVTQLINYISNLDILVTGDSGPMHIAASFKIPTIALFGPTNEVETSQWNNLNSIIIKKNLECQPCMKRTCPLKHHNCMKHIKAKEVIESIPLVLS